MRRTADEFEELTTSTTAVATSSTTATATALTVTVPSGTGYGKFIITNLSTNLSVYSNNKLYRF
jgi:hypothetical protein